MRFIGVGFFAVVVGALAGCGDVTPVEQLLGCASACDLSGAKDALAKGASPNARETWSGETPLMAAAYGGCPEVTRALIAAGADPNGRTRGSGVLSGQTPLMRGAEGRGNVETVKALIQGGADVNAKSVDGYTPLAAAARYGNFEIAKALIAAGADVNARETDGLTPLAETLRSPKDGQGNQLWGTPQSHADTTALLRAHGGLDEGAKR